MKRIEIDAGSHIRDAVAEALAVAIQSGETVTFDFNGTEHEVLADDSLATAIERAGARTGLRILSADEEAEKFREERKDTEETWAREIAAAGAMTEQEMRAAEVPSIGSEEELLAYVRSLVKRPHDYGTCVYAMSMAAHAAFRYVARELGVTGFQAGCADMDFIRRTRHLEHGFRLLDYGKLLYPQFMDHEHFPTARYLLQDPVLHNRLAEVARKNLAESEHSAESVRAHWQWLVDSAPPEPAEVPA